MNTPEWNNKTRERDNQKNKWTESSREQWKMESETASKDPILRRRTYQLREATSVSNSNRLFPMPHLGPENAKFRYCYFATTLSRHFPLPSLFRLTFCIFFSFLVFNISSFRMWTLFSVFLVAELCHIFSYRCFLLSVLIPLSPNLFFLSPSFIFQKLIISSTNLRCFFCFNYICILQITTLHLSLMFKVLM